MRRSSVSLPSSIAFSTTADSGHLKVEQSAKRSSVRCPVVRPLAESRKATPSRPPDWRSSPARRPAIGSDSCGSFAGASLAPGVQPESRVQPAKPRSEEHTSELQSLMRISYAVFCLKKKHHTTNDKTDPQRHDSQDTTPLN